MSKSGIFGVKTCNFCNKDQNEVYRLIASPSGVHVCNECIDVCNEIIEEQREKDRSISQTAIKVPKPVDIRSFLDDYVVGQEKAKKALAVAVHNHYKRISAIGSKRK